MHQYGGKIELLITVCSNGGLDFICKTINKVLFSNVLCHCMKHDEAFVYIPLRMCVIIHPSIIIII